MDGGLLLCNPATLAVERVMRGHKQACPSHPDARQRRAHMGASTPASGASAHAQSAVRGVGRGGVSMRLGPTMRAVPLRESRRCRLRTGWCTRRATVGSSPPVGTDSRSCGTRGRSALQPSEQARARAQKRNEWCDLQRDSDWPGMAATASRSCPLMRSARGCSSGSA
jgi:hypothetical protein